jgi:2',3'-cyclic-nucleotide 2'-phosphodiesterase
MAKAKEKEGIRIMFLGDICGKPGREVLAQSLAQIKRDENIDLCLANIENLAHGRGANRSSYEEIASYGVDAFTGGNHIFRLEDIYEYLQDPSKNLIRPANYYDDVIGRGHMVVDLGGSKGKILVISLIGKAYFNENTEDPFRVVDRILEKYQEDEIDGIIVDFHAEATSEKIMAGWYLDGRVSAVVGTHTHVPTADERVLPGGTAFITDIGMVGPMDSALWVKKDVMVKFLKYPYPAKFEIEEEGPVRLDAVIIDVLGRNKAKSIQRLNMVFN